MGGYVRAYAYPAGLADLDAEGFVEGEEVHIERRNLARNRSIYTYCTLAKGKGIEGIKILAFKEETR
jgi:hypothetical protein